MKTRLPEFVASKEQIEEADRFHESLRHRYEAALHNTHDGIGAFFQSGQVTIRVFKIELLPAIGVLMLTGVDENDSRIVVSGYFKSMTIMFLELAKDAPRTPVEFGVPARAFLAD